MAGSTEAPVAIRGAALAIAGIVLAASNFMVVLDTTIANVSVPHIAGSLGISTSQGIWIITSYSVAEAICVPLTGWLAGRFGAVRTFIFCMMGFGIFSMLCGMSPTLGMLVACRIGQGLCGGPLMPLSQTLLMRIFPPEQRNQAMALWAMTTVVAPILGPIFGGSISDAWSWHWIFFINVPVVLLCSFGAMRVLRPAETPTEDLRVDRTGLVLMIIWIGALQILLDLGRERDWFGDPLQTVEIQGIDRPIEDFRGVHHTPGASLLGLFAFTAFERASRRGARFVPQTDERAFPFRRPKTPLERGMNEAIRRLLDLR